jgi:hypothetical protein
METGGQSGRSIAESMTWGSVDALKLRIIAGRGTWSRGVAGSNPVAPTTFRGSILSGVWTVYSERSGNTFGPTPPSSSTPPPLPAEPTGDLPPVTTWKITQRFVSVVGPDNCWVREQRARLTGAIFTDLPGTVDHSSRSIGIQGPLFEIYFSGEFYESQFSTSSGPPLQGAERLRRILFEPCQDGTSVQQAGRSTSRLSGQFSPDNQVMTGTEVNTYFLTTGEVVNYRWEWHGTRQN